MRGHFLRFVFSVSTLHFQNSPHTVDNYLESILRLHIENKLNKKQTDRLLKMNSKFFPNDHNAPTSWYKFQKMCLQKITKVSTQGNYSLIAIV